MNREAKAAIDYMEEIITRENKWFQRMMNRYPTCTPRPGYYWSQSCNAWIKGDRPMPSEDEARRIDEARRLDKRVAEDNNDEDTRESKKVVDRLAAHILAHDNNDNCYREAKERGQATFTLVAQDITAPRCVMQWIIENLETATDAKLREAFEKALLMKNYYLRKHPYNKFL